jgi:hypothetical protein
MLGIPPEFIWILAIVILGLAIFYGMRRRPLSGSERQRSEEAARENWGKENIH